MVKIEIENFSEDALKKLYCDLDNKNDDCDDCELCSMPTLLHCDTSGKRIPLGTCTRISVPELNKAWSLFRKKIRPIRIWYTDNMEKRQKNSNFLQGLKTMTETIMNGNEDIEGLEKYIGEHVEELDTIEKQTVKEMIVHEENCYICEQCDNWYESRKDFEDHRRRRHSENFYICEQCENLYESREDLEDHRKRRHTKECEEKFVCRNEREQ